MNCIFKISIYLIQVSPLSLVLSLLSPISFISLSSFLISLLLNLTFHRCAIHNFILNNISLFFHISIGWASSLSFNQRQFHVLSICVNLCQFVSICVNLCQFVSICVNLCQFVSICVNLCQFVSI
jgi:hypothetical protein